MNVEREEVIGKAMIAFEKEMIRQGNVKQSARFPKYEKTKATFFKTDQPKYAAILKCLKANAPKKMDFEEVSASTGLDQRECVLYLNNLSRIKMIHRDFPQQKERKGRTRSLYHM